MPKAAKPTKAEMRVAIMKDVLKSLPKRDVVRGSYMRSDYKPTKHFDKALKGQKELAGMMEKECSMCALGNIFVSRVRVTNEITLNDVMCEDSDIMGEKNGMARLAYTGQASRSLRKYFTFNQLELIEAAFEGFMGCADYHLNFKTPKDTLRAIAKNIIRNNGTFKPKQDMPKQVASTT